MNMTAARITTPIISLLIEPSASETIISEPKPTTGPTYGTRFPMPVSIPITSAYGMPAMSIAIDTMTPTRRASSDWPLMYPENTLLASAANELILALV